MKIILILLFIFEFYLIIKSEKMIKLVIKNRKNYNESNQKQNIKILLPIHCEDNILESAVDKFVAIFSENSIVLICGNENRKNDTYERLKKLQHEKKYEIEILYDSAKKSTKSSKLNYAIKYLNSKYTDYVFGVYDFDSIPSKTVINEVGKKYTLAKCLQDIPVTLNNFEHTSSIIISYNIFQLRRTLGLEGINLFSNNNLKKINYLMGSGMYLNSEIINDIGMFPINSDDIETGYLLSFRGEYEVILPVFNLVCTVYSMKDLVNQGIRIFMGSMTFYKILKKNKISIESIKIFFKLAFDTLNENLTTLVILANVIYDILNKNYYNLLIEIFIFIFINQYYSFKLIQLGEFYNIKYIIMNKYKIVLLNTVLLFLPWIIRLYIFIKYMLHNNSDDLLMISSQKKEI